MTTTTANKTAEWNALITEEDGSVTPSSYSAAGDIINKPSEEMPAPMRVSDLRFKGYLRMWDTQTGVESLTPKWLWWQVERMKHPDGTQMYTRTDPQIPPNHGADLFCPLNPASGEYDRLKGMGFKPCRKRHIPNQAALLSHVKSSHKRAWVALEREREDRERQEGLDLQREAIAGQNAILKALAGNLSVEKQAPVSPDAETETVATLAAYAEQVTANVAQETFPESTKPRKYRARKSGTKKKGTKKK